LIRSSYCNLAVERIASAAPVDPLKEIKRCGRWIIEAQKYVYEMNKVLETEVATRNVAWDKMMDVKDNLKLTNFLHGKLVVWNNKKHVFSHTEGQPGYLTCDVCGTKHRFKKVSRALRHVTDKQHHQTVKKNSTLLLLIAVKT